MNVDESVINSCDRCLRLEESVMRIEEFADMKQFERIMSNWAVATGLATVAIGTDGKYISKCYNFTDFCSKYTRGSAEGKSRCEKCDKEGNGVYNCHAGLIDFSIDLVVKGEKVGAVIGGQVLSQHPDEEKFRQVAREIGVNEDRYIEALGKVTVKSEGAIKASAELLGEVLNDYINVEYERKQNAGLSGKLTGGVERANVLVDEVIAGTKELKAIQGRQKILALNASIEAARAGEVGAGFSIVAKEVEKLSESSSVVNSKIESLINEIDQIVSSMKYNE